MQQKRQEQCHEQHQSGADVKDGVPEQKGPSPTNNHEEADGKVVSSPAALPKSMSKKLEPHMMSRTLLRM